MRLHLQSSARTRLFKASFCPSSTYRQPSPNSVTRHSAALSRAFSLHLLPGSFNPPHDGHARMMSAALRAPGQPHSPPDALGLFELSAVNVDKPPPSPLAILQRVQRCFAPGSPLRQSAILITQCPRFIEKSSVPRPIARTLRFSLDLNHLTFAAAASGRQLHLCHWLRHLSAFATEQVLLRFHTGFSLAIDAGKPHFHLV